MQLWYDLTANEFIPDFFRREDNEASAIIVKYYCSLPDDLYTIDINGYHISSRGPELKLTPMSEYCYLEGGNWNVPITKELLLRPYAGSSDSRGGFQPDNIRISGFSTDSYAIELSGIDNIYSKASGELEFNYGNTPISYKLNRRPMRIYSKDRELNMTIVSHPSENKMVISGDVSEARLSDLDLFPSFSSWYRNNIYLAPITLITTIFAGVTMMRSSRKIKDGLDNNRKVIPIITINVKTHNFAPNLSENQAPHKENNK